MLGVAAARDRRAHQACIAGSADGQRRSMSASQSQPSDSSRLYAARSSSVCAHVVARAPCVRFA